MIPRRTRRIFSLDHNPAESLPGHQSRLAAGCLPRGTNSVIFLLAADHRFAITGHHPSARPLSFPLGCVYVRFFFQRRRNCFGHAIRTAGRSLRIWGAIKNCTHLVRVALMVGDFFLFYFFHLSPF